MIYLQTFEAFEFKKKKKIKKHIKKGRGGVVNIMSRISSEDGSLPDFLENVSKRFEVSVIKYENCGAFGMAFLADSDKVIKITSEKSEAANVKSLIGKRIPGCLDYYDIVYSRKFDVYCILMERVKTLTEKEMELYNNMFDAFDYATPPVKPNFIKYVLYETQNRFTKAEAEKCFDLITDLKRKLQSAGVNASDLHTGNLGWRNGELVHFDIMSQVTRRQDLDKISKIKKRK